MGRLCWECGGTHDDLLAHPRRPREHRAGTWENASWLAGTSTDSTIPASSLPWRDAVVHLRFDDGQTAWIDEAEAVPLELPPGTRLSARWRGGPQYYPGSVSQADGERVHIRYDDSDEEWTTAEMVRVQR